MKIYASNVNGLTNMFCYNTDETPGSLKMFAITNSLITFHTSLYADD